MRQPTDAQLAFLRAVAADDPNEATHVPDIERQCDDAEWTEADGFSKTGSRLTRDGRKVLAGQAVRL